MRFTKRNKTYGERIVSKFLIFPRYLRTTNSHSREFRWLEKAEVIQKYRTEIKGWEDIYWAN